MMSFHYITLTLMILLVASILLSLKKGDRKYSLTYTWKMTTRVGKERNFTTIGDDFNFPNDILYTLCRLSKTLQRSDITLGDAHIMLTSTVDLLELKRNSKSEKLVDVLEEKEYKGYKLKAKGVVCGDNTSLVSPLVASIKGCFDDVLEDEIAATQIACLRNWPVQLTSGYGDRYAQALRSRFEEALLGQGLDVESLLSEWRHLQGLVYRRFHDVHSVKWSDVNIQFSHLDVSNTHSFINLINSLPATSVFNETAFNQLKLLKTDRPHSLTEQHLKDCMVVKLECASVTDFDPDPAINRWMTTPTGQRRRFGYKRMPKSSRQTDAEIEQNSQNEAEASDGIHVDTEQNKDIQIIEDDDNDNLNEENEIKTDLSEITETVENAQNESTENKTVENAQDENNETETIEIVNEKNETAENENANEQSVESDNEQDDMDCEDSDFEFEQTDEKNFFFLQKYASEE